MTSSSSSPDSLPIANKITKTDSFAEVNPEDKESPFIKFLIILQDIRQNPTPELDVLFQELYGTPQFIVAEGIEPPQRRVVIKCHQKTFFSWPPLKLQLQINRQFFYVEKVAFVQRDVARDVQQLLF